MLDRADGLVGANGAVWRREKRQSGNAADYSRKPRVGNGAPTRFPFGRETATTATSTRTATATFDRRQRPRNAIGRLCDGWQRAFFLVSRSTVTPRGSITGGEASFFVPFLRFGWGYARRDARRVAGGCCWDAACPMW